MKARYIRNELIAHYNDGEIYEYSNNVLFFIRGIYYRNIYNDDLLIQDFQRMNEIYLDNSVKIKKVKHIFELLYHYIQTKYGYDNIKSIEWRVDLQTGFDSHIIIIYYDQFGNNILSKKRILTENFQAEIHNII